VVGLGVVELHRVQLEHSSGSHLLRKPEVLAIRVTTASEKFDKTLFVSFPKLTIAFDKRRNNQILVINLERKPREQVIARFPGLIRVFLKKRAKRKEK